MNAARRVSRLQAYPFARWSAQVRKAQERDLDVIRLDIGNPDLPPPEAAVAALCQAAHGPDQHGCQGYRGLDTLRRATAGYYARRFGVVLDPDAEILPLIGSKEGIVNLAQACLSPGDLVLAPDPGYAAYAGGARLAGAEVHMLPLRAERGFQPDFDAIPGDLAQAASLLWLNYPNNPTGATADLDFLAGSVSIATRHRILLCHDVAYCDVTFDGYVAPSVLQVRGAMDVAVEFSSPSKTYNMAGWRLGFLTGNAGVIEAVAEFKSNIDSGQFRPLQEAAIAAFQTSPGWLERRNKIYARRPGIVLDGLAQAGLDARRTADRYTSGQPSRRAEPARDLPSRSCGTKASRSHRARSSVPVERVTSASASRRAQIGFARRWNALRWLAERLPAQGPCARRLCRQIPYSLFRRNAP